MGQTAVKAAEMLSPGADIRDAVDASAQTGQAAAQGDVLGAVKGAADILGNMAGIYLPGTFKGMKDGAKIVVNGVDDVARRTLPDVSKVENPISAKEFSQLPDSGSIDPRVRTYNQ